MATSLALLKARWALMKTIRLAMNVLKGKVSERCVHDRGFVSMMTVKSEGGGSTKQHSACAWSHYGRFPTIRGSLVVLGIIDGVHDGDNQEGRRWSEGLIIPFELLLDMLPPKLPHETAALRIRLDQYLTRRPLHLSHHMRARL